ncbi:MAG: hypothetical protein LRY26_00015 [Bacilli bacterium]|nr:hypothetical protein [Bacilli bacterium]
MNNNLKWVEDIDYLVNELEMYHPNPYFNVEKGYFMSIINDIKNENKGLLEKLTKALNLLKDAHTTIDISSYGSPLPIEFKIEDSKVYLVNTIEEYKDFLYEEVLSINGVNIKDLLI